MKAFNYSVCWVTAGLLPLAAALSIAEINGNRFLSPFSGQTVENVTGLLLAKGPNGIWIRSMTPDKDAATSEAVYVFSNTVGANLTTGDIVTLDGKVTEFRSTANYLYLTEITSPANVRRLSSGNAVKPVVIGKDTQDPPTVQYSDLDGGDVYAVPNAMTNISVANPVLDPKKYGLDFWESLSGELVTVRKPRVIQRPNNFRDTWVVGDWAVSGRNSHGGLTMSDKDSNPEAILIGSPLDGTRNPTTSKMGDTLDDITGIVQHAFGFYSILPLTSIKPKPPASSIASPTTLTSSSLDCRSLTIGSYNVENLAPNSSHLPSIAAHIVTYLLTPDLIFLQEIQDSSGPADDGTLSANLTLSTLCDAIYAKSGVRYAFASVDPLPGNLDGGQPGGNIRQAYLYREEVVGLYKPRQGSGGDATGVVVDSDSDTDTDSGSVTKPKGQGKGKEKFKDNNKATADPSLTFNPGRIDPANPAWEASRKPIAAAWIAKGAKRPFYTVNIHFSSKGGGTTLHGDARPPVNGGVARRKEQALVTGNFIAKILQQSPSAAVIAAGDFNEFAFVEPMRVFSSVSGLVDLDEAAGIAEVERYTYVFDMNAQALDHMYVSPSLARSRSTRYQHLHVNSWAAAADVVSDHDPSVARFDVCG